MGFWMHVYMHDCITILIYNLALGGGLLELIAVYAYNGFMLMREIYCT